jgi:hypothetical protein
MKKLLVGLIVLVALLSVPMVAMAETSGTGSAYVNATVNSTIEISAVGSSGWTLNVGSNTLSKETQTPTAPYITINSTDNYTVKVKDARTLGGGVYPACAYGYMCKDGSSSPRLTTQMQIKCDGNKTKGSGTYANPLCMMNSLTGVVESQLDFAQGEATLGDQFWVGVSQTVVYGDPVQQGAGNTPIDYKILYEFGVSVN